MAKSKSAITDTPDAVEALATSTGAEIVQDTELSVIEQDAVALLEAARLLVDADTPEKVSVALDHNLRLWVAIKTVLKHGDNKLDSQVKANLRNLADYVSRTTMAATEGSIEERKMVALSRINTQIAEGLLRGQQSRLVHERAYEIWEQEGRPAGRETEHWARAEAEIAELLNQR